MEVNVTVAAFDVDNTLTVRDCVVPFMRSVSGTSRIVKLLLSDLGGTLQSLRRRDRDSLKAKFVEGVFSGKDARDIDALGIEFATRWLTVGCVTTLLPVCGGIKTKDTSLSSYRRRWVHTCIR